MGENAKERIAVQDLDLDRLTKVCAGSCVYPLADAVPAVLLEHIITGPAAIFSSDV